MGERVEWAGLSHQDQLAQLRGFLEGRYYGITDAQWETLCKAIEDGMCDYSQREHRDYFITAAKPYFAFGGTHQDAPDEEPQTPTPLGVRCSYEESFLRAQKLYHGVKMMQIGAEQHLGRPGSWREITDAVNSHRDLFPWLSKPISEAHLKVIYSRARKQSDLVADVAATSPEMGNWILGYHRYKTSYEVYRERTSRAARDRSQSAQ